MSEKEVHHALAGIHHDGLEEGGSKSRLAKALDGKTVECIILLLVFVDIGLLSVEAGIDHHLLCIDGKVVPKPMGMPPPHHFFLESPNGYMSAHTAPMTSVMFPVLQQLKLIQFPNGDDSRPRENGKEQSNSRMSVKQQRRGLTSSYIQQQHNKMHTNHAFLLDPKEDAHSKDHGSVKHEVSTGGESEAHGQHGEHTKEEHGEHAEHGHHAHPDEVLMCETRHGHHAHHIAHNCHTASIVILVIFLIEISLKYWVNPDAFVHNWFLILDATVITVSLITDTVVMWYVQSHHTKIAGHEVSESDLATIAAALLFVRCWRVVRIAHGLAEHMHHAHEREHKATHMEEELHQTKQELHHMKQELTEAKEELNITKSELQKARGYEQLRGQVG